MDRVAGLYIKVDANEAKAAASHLELLTKRAKTAEDTLKRLRQLSKDANFAKPVLISASAAKAATGHLDELSKRAKLAGEAVHQLKQVAKDATFSKIVLAGGASVRDAVEQLNRLEKQARAVDSTIVRLKQLSKNVNFSNTLLVSASSVKVAAKNLDLLAKRAKTVEETILRLGQLAANAGLSNSVFDGAATGLDKLAKQAIAADDAIKRLNQTLKGSSASTSAIKRATLADERSARALRDHEKANRALKNSVDDVGRSLEKKENYLVRIAKRAAAATVGVYVFAKALQLVKSSVAIESAYESIGKQLKFIEGSSYSAAETMQFLRREADLSGARLQDVAAQYGKLAYALRAIGISKEDTRELFRGVSAAAATFGLSPADTGGVLVAFTQIANKGIVTAEELRNQIGERLAGAFAIAAKAMGMTTVELSRAMERGEVMAYDFIPKLARALSDEFVPSLKENTDTIIAETNRLKNAWDGLITSITSGKLIKAGANFTASLLESAKDQTDYLREDLTEKEKLLLDKKNLEKRINRQKEYVNWGNPYGSMPYLGGVRPDVIVNYRNSPMGAKGKSNDIYGYNQAIKTLAEIESKLKDIEEVEAKIIAEEDAKKQVELAKTVAERVVSSWDKAYEQIDSARQSNLRREFEAANRVKSLIDKQVSEMKKALEMPGMPEAEAKDISNTIEQALKIDPFAGLKSASIASWTQTIDKTLSDSQRLMKQYENDVNQITEINNYLTKAYGQNTLFNFEQTLDSLFNYYWGELAKVNKSGPDLTNLRNRVSYAESEYNYELGKQEKGLSQMKAGVGGDNLLGNLFDEFKLTAEAESRLEGIRKSYETHKEVILSMQLEEGQTAIELEQTKLERLYALNKEYQDKVQKLSTESQGRQVQWYGQFQDDLLVLAKSGSKSMARVLKAVAIANTIISTYQGAQNAFTALAGIPIVGPALGMAAAGVAIAAGMARINAIRATNYAGAYEHGGMIPAGSVGLVGEAGPELVRGPAMVTSARSTKDQNIGRGKQPIVINNRIVVDQRGALVEVGAIRRLEQTVKAINASIETRAVGAVSNARIRNPQFLSR